jgi:hypothetical protein
MWALSRQLVRVRVSASGVVMSLMSAAFANTTMPDNNAMNLTRSSQSAWGPRRLLQCSPDRAGEGW